MDTPDLYQQALTQFKQLLSEAIKAEHIEPYAMTLATATANGRPSSRTVLLKDFDDRGFVFFSSRLSRKGQQLSENPNASLCVYWHDLHEQVSIDGKVEIISNTEADAYWATRPRDNQIGAWASLQSQLLDNRETLAQRQEEIKQQYRNSSIPRPDYWVGYRLQPNRIEFWKSGWKRLNERQCYQLDGKNVWRQLLLYP